MNTYVRQLDLRYNALSGAQKAAWKAAAVAWPWLCYCLPDIYDFPEGGFLAGTGVQAYRTVNCSNLDSGLPVSDIPPSSVTAYDGDFIFLLFEPDGVYALWAGRSADPVGTFVVDVRLTMANNVPTQGPAVQKFVYQFTAPIDYFVPVLLFPAVSPAPPPSLTVYIAGLAVVQVGAGPLFADRLPLV